MRNVVRNIELDSFTDDFSSVHSKASGHQDCEELFHAGKQSPDIADGVHVDRDDLHAGNGDLRWFHPHGKTQVTIENVQSTDESLDPTKIRTGGHRHDGSTRKPHRSKQHKHGNQQQPTRQVTQEKRGEREKRERVKEERRRRKEGELREKGTRRSRTT